MLRQRAALLLSAGLAAACATGRPPASLLETRSHPEQPTAAEWREDLRALQSGIEHHHADAFHAVDRKAFDARVSALETRIGSLDSDAIVVEMMRLVAAIGDGHTMLVGLPSSRVQLHAYGVRFRQFEDGLFVIAAEERYSGAVAGRVVRIGTTAVQEAMQRVFAIVPGDNDIDRRYRAPFYLAMPEVLAGLGIAPPAHAVSLEVETADGGQRRFVLEPSSRVACFPRLPCSRDRSLPQGWVDARRSWLSPLARDDGGDASPHFRLELLEAGATLYVELKVVLDDPNETLEAFWKRAMAHGDHAQRLVLDLRRNHGGDNTLNEVILRDLATRTALNRRGHLFVLVGRETFSAAQNLATRLERSSSAIFVGEPTGGRPNHYGDLHKIPLPNSGLVATASTKFWQDSEPGDRRPFLTPTVPSIESFADYRSGRDVALEAALRAPGDAKDAR